MVGGAGIRRAFKQACRPCAAPGPDRGRAAPPEPCAGRGGYDEAGDVNMEIKSHDRNIKVMGGDININVTGGAVNIKADNDVHIDGDAIISGISFLGHTHTGVHGGTTPPH